MKKQSAGLVVYRTRDGKLEVLIGHMGGPWFAKKDAGAWSIPKGEYQEGEDPLEVAKREFIEELSKPVPEGDFKQLGTIEQKNKSVVAWAVEGDMDVSDTKSNTFKIEWPPRSGKIQEFSEIDRAQWFSPEEAAKRVIAGQAEFFERLAKILKAPFNVSEEPKQGSLF